MYAVDTDSIHTNISLPDSWVGNDLGQWKLEFVGSLAYYPLPKVYMSEGFKVKDGIVGEEFKTIKKGKGVGKGTITKDEYIKLLQGKSIEKTETRFIVDKKNSSVKLKDVSINIQPDLTTTRVMGYYVLGTMLLRWSNP